MALTYAARADRNQVEIVGQLRALGFDVDIVHRQKKMYDLVVSGTPLWASQAVAVRVEVKAENGQLTSDEADYWEAQKNVGNLIIARSADDVLHWFGRI